MTGNEERDAEAAFEKLRAEFAQGRMHIFTEDEARALVEVAKTWAQLKAVVSLGGTIGAGLKWMVMFMVAWGAFKAGIFDFLSSGGAGK